MILKKVKQNQGGKDTQQKSICSFFFWGRGGLSCGKIQVSASRFKAVLLMIPKTCVSTQPAMYVL
jgi:hypothetical protein